MAQNSVGAQQDLLHFVYPCPDTSEAEGLAMKYCLSLALTPHNIH